MSFWKKNKRILLVYGILVLLFTAGTITCIIYFNNTRSIDTKIVTKGFRNDKVDIYNPINTEAMKYEEKAYKDGDIQINTLVFQGLKDKDILNKINTDIEDKVNEIISDAKKKENKKFKNITINVLEYANFANILSLSITSWSDYIQDTDEVYSTNSTLNYDLNTGDYLEITDLFISEDATLKFLTKTAYESISKHYGFSDIYSERSKKEDYSKVEDDLVKFIYEYNKGQLSFHFSESSIFISSPSFDTYYISNNFYDYRDDITFFTKFISKKSLFEDSEKIVLSPLNGVYKENDLFKYYDANTFVNIIFDWGDYNDKKVSKKDIIDMSINYVKSSYKNKGLILESYMYADNKSTYDVVEIRYNGSIYVTTPSYLKDSLYKEYMEYITQPLDRRFEENENGRKNTNSNYSIIESYNTFLFSNGKIIKNLEDLFVKGYDYETIIKDHLKTYFIPMEVNENEINSIYNGCNFKININGIYIEHDDYRPDDYGYATMSYSNFSANELIIKEKK